MYRVILTKNGDYKMTLHRCKTIEASFINYHKIIDDNKSVMFPKKFINYDGIKPVKYRLYIVKDTEDGDKFRTRRDSMGRTYSEKPLFGIWTVIDDQHYELEETFWLYGRDPKNDRVTIHEIINSLFKNITEINHSKQIIVVHNKLIIYNEKQFDMVICKCKKDAQRLHHELNKSVTKAKINGLVFMGTASKVMTGKMYDIIKENTGWDILKIRRTSTRP
tara:strand:+ start:11957 stop:12616 length:660 start_codon:yes stop_codon:yes gene_type:complete